MPRQITNIDYLRISVTDRCNFRCIYCMPLEGLDVFRHEDMLTLEEIARLAKIFAALGTKRIRITGGEPLVRKGLLGLVNSLTAIPGIEEVSLTTNASLLGNFAQDLKRSGIKRLNISLDTLKGSKFKKISGVNNFEDVLQGIEEARRLDFSPIKINVVVMKGVNDDEINDFLEFAAQKDLVVRFIEFMRLSPLWKTDYFVSAEQIKESCRSRFALEKVQVKGYGPAEYFRLNNSLVGFIRTDESNCLKCNRLRLTSDGELKICLYEGKGLSLRDLLRKGCSDEFIRDMISSRIGIKLNSSFKNWEDNKSYLCSIGG